MPLHLFVLKEIIMKCYVSLIIAFFFITGLFAIEVSGSQSGTWTAANNPHLLVGDVSIPAGAVLTIEPGVIVQAMGSYRINAAGTIQAVGTQTDSIRFENGQFPLTTLWKGIRLENNTEQSNFMHIVVEYAEYGINAVDSPMEVSYSRFSYNQRGLHLYGIGNSNPAVMNVHHNLIEHTQQNGILIPQNSNAWVHHNEVRYNGTVTQYYGAIQLSNQSTGGQNNPIIEHNYIHSNFKQGITAWDVVGAGAINATIRHNHIEGNLTGIYLLNSSGTVHDNLIINNFIPGDTNSGAGMMIGGATSMPYIAGNTLTGNFTGFYITSNAMPVLGDLSIDHAFAYGQNIIRDNIDGSGTLHSVVCASYPNSGNVIKAENNDWGVYSAAEIAIGIMDQNDNAALPTVDFEPWYQPQSGITISGSYSWDTEDYDDLPPQDLKLLVVDRDSREIMESHVLTGNPFSIESFVDNYFFAVITAVDPSREIWGAMGGLDGYTSIDHSQGNIVLDDIYLDAWQHYDAVAKGPIETIEGREVWGEFHRFLMFPFHKVDYFYDEGDYRYIYKHEYRDEEGWHSIDFPWGTTYYKILNLQYNDAWHQNCVEDGELVQYFFLYYHDDEGRDILNGIPPHLSEYQKSKMRIRDEESDHIYLINEDNYTVKHYEVVVENPVLWKQYHKPLPIYPTELSLKSSFDEETSTYNLQLIWVPPTDSGVEFTEYRVFMLRPGYGPTCLAIFSYGITRTYLVESIMAAGQVQFWVEACDDYSISMPSNIVTFDFSVSNADLVQQPELKIYPNPVSFRAGNALHAEVKGIKQAELKIYNLRGQQVLSTKLHEEKFSWNGKDAKGKAVGSGIYFMRVESGGKQLLSRKLVITK
jgi:hypothetical protein